MDTFNQASSRIEKRNQAINHRLGPGFHISETELWDWLLLGLVSTSSEWYSDTVLTRQEAGIPRS